MAGRAPDTHAAAVEKRVPTALEGQIGQSACMGQAQSQVPLRLEENDEQPLL